MIDFKLPFFIFFIALLLTFFATSALAESLNKEFPEGQNYRIGIDTTKDGWSSINIWHRGVGCARCFGAVKFKHQMSDSKKWKLLTIKVNSHATCDNKTRMICPLGKLTTYAKIDTTDVNCEECNQPPRQAQSKPSIHAM